MDEKSEEEKQRERDRDKKNDAAQGPPKRGGKR